MLLMNSVWNIILAFDNKFYLTDTKQIGVIYIVTLILFGMSSKRISKVI